MILKHRFNPFRVLSGPYFHHFRLILGIYFKFGLLIFKASEMEVLKSAHFALSKRQIEFLNEI